MLTTVCLNGGTLPRTVNVGSRYFLKRKCDQVHEHVQVELKESGFYPEKLGLELVKSAQKTLGARISPRGGVKNFPCLVLFSSAGVRLLAAPDKV